MPRAVAGNTTPMRVESPRSNPLSDSPAPNNGKSKRTRSTNAGPSKSSNANRPIILGVATATPRSKRRIPSNDSSPLTYRRSNTHCCRSTNAGGSGAIRDTPPESSPWRSGLVLTRTNGRSAEAIHGSPATTNTTSDVTTGRENTEAPYPTPKAPRQEPSRATSTPRESVP